MKILIIDAIGTGLDFAVRCLSYDHDVKLYIRNREDGTRCKIGDGGLVNRVTDRKYG